MGPPHSSHRAGWAFSLHDTGDRKGGCPNTSWHHRPAPFTRQQLPARVQGLSRGGLFLGYLMSPLKKPHIPESPQTPSFEMGFVWDVSFPTQEHHIGAGLRWWLPQYGHPWVPHPAGLPWVPHFYDLQCVLSVVWCHLHPLRGAEIFIACIFLTALKIASLRGFISDFWKTPPPIYGRIYLTYL